MSGHKDSAATSQLNQSNNYATQANNNQTSAYNALDPMYMTEMTNPTASPLYQAENTASNQALGGATASAMGQGNLMAARTNNKAGYAPALDSAVRTAGQTQSENAANNAAGVQKSGAAGVQGLESGQQQELQGMMGLAPSTIGQMNGPAWQSILGAVTGLGQAGANAYKTYSA